MFQCNHLLPRKHNGIRSLRGVDRVFTAKLIEAGYTVRVASIYDEQEYDLPDYDVPVKRKTCVRLPPRTNPRRHVVLARLERPETKDVDDDLPRGYTGNESAPGFLQYTTCGIAVTRPASSTRAQSPLSPLIF